jgi:hypothetical protein
MYKLKVRRTDVLTDAFNQLLEIRSDDTLQGACFGLCAAFVCGTKSYLHQVYDGLWTC